MKAKWISTKHAGVRYREHETRKHGIGLDRYFSIRYRVDGKLKEEGLGWASEGWTAEKAMLTRAELRQAATKGEGPRTLAEKREIAEVQRQADQAKQKAEEAQSLTFGDYFKETYWPRQDYKSKGALVAEDCLFRLWLEPVLGKVRLADLAQIHLEKVRQTMTKAGRKPKSAQYAIGVFSQVWTMARDEGLVSGDSPGRKVRIKVENKRTRFLSQDEAHALLEELSKASPDMHDISLLALRTGARFGELAKLTGQDVDLDNGLVRFKDTKSGETRHVPLTTDAQAMLQDRQPGRGPELVFPSRTGLIRPAPSKAFIRAIDRLGFNDGVDDIRDKVTFHTLRHTCASWLVMAGESLFKVGKLLGHSQIKTTERYSHLAPDGLKDTMATLEAISRPKVVDIATART